jgi:biotin-dependent carboxylase-like uncharacterized protein
MSFTVLTPGLETTVQDLGRSGFRQLGVALGGALDPLSLQAGNALLGNAPAAAGLEFALTGPTLRAETEQLIAVLGAGSAATLDGRPLPRAQPVRLAAGSVLKLGPLTYGARSWLCVAGGLALASVLGSCSTDLSAGFGGLQGRALRAGDRLPVGPRPPAASRLLEQLAARGAVAAPWGVAVDRAAPGPLRVLPYADADLRGFRASGWTVAADSNRMGVRLQGAALPVEAGGTRLSAGVAPGAIQLLPSGQPIVLLADAQTIGGYPLLGAVIRADLPRLAQARPGGRLQFEVVSLADAEGAAREQEVALARLTLAATARLAAWS